MTFINKVNVKFAADLVKTKHNAFRTVIHLELSDAVAQCKSHVGQLRSMLWIGHWYSR